MCYVAVTSLFQKKREVPAKGVHPSLPTALSRKANECTGKQAVACSIPKHKKHAFPRSIICHRVLLINCTGSPPYLASGPHQTLGTQNITV